MTRLLPLLLLVGCTQKVGFQNPPDDTDTAVDTDTGHTGGGDSDTVDDDGDLDDDGFTAEEGDCDDNDVRVSPARDEEDGDGLDNDCDGRTDEAWSGFDVAFSNMYGSSEILTINRTGTDAESLTLDADCYPLWLDHAQEGDPSQGWIVNNGYGYVTHVGADGKCEDLADFTKSTSCDLGGVYGVAVGVDGTIYATTLDTLVSVGRDGTVTELASWSCNLMDPGAHELAVYSLAVDPETGELALYGYFGGFALWNPTDGLRVRHTEDLENIAVYTYSGAHMDDQRPSSDEEGGWFTPGIDGATGGYGIYQYDLAADEWVQVEGWEDEDWVPFMLAIDGDSGDYYVTANAGWYYRLWRIASGSGYAARLYGSEGVEPYRAFNGVVTNYTYGE